MPLLDLGLSQESRYLGNNVSVGRAPSNFRGAAVNIIGAPAQFITTNAAVIFNTVVFDTDNWFDVLSPDLFTVPDGVSIIRFVTTISYFSNTYATNDRVTFQVEKNGVIFPGHGAMSTPPVVNNAHRTVISPPILVVPGDTIGINVTVTTVLSIGTLIIGGATTYMAIEAIL